MVSQAGRAGGGGVEGGMDAHEVVVEQIGVEAILKTRQTFGEGEGATGEGGNRLAEGEIEAFNESSVDGGTSVSQTKSGFPSLASTEE